MPTLADQTMTIERVQTELGYSEIKIDTVEIPDKFEIILHRVYPEEIFDLVRKLESNLKIIELEDHRDLVENRIKSIKNKIKTLVPHRVRRGLVNLGGSTLKWIFGTMDNDDRQNIENHLTVVDQNNHKLMQTINQQIKINENFNRTFRQIKDIIETDRTKILARLNQLNFTEFKILSENLFLEQMFKIDHIERQVEHIQDNIASARLGLLHPNILTDEEINEYEIDFNKLSNIRLAVAKHVDNSLVFAIKIPVHNIVTNKILLVPIVNSEGKQIDSGIEYIIRHKNRMLTYIAGKSLKELSESKNCINLSNCKFLRNDKEEILSIEDNMIIINNIKIGKLKSTCDERIMSLSGNYFINFNNCTVKINDREFTNNLRIFTQKFVLPKFENKSYDSKPLDFEKIVLENANNLEKLKELRYHKIVNYSLGPIFVIILVLIVIASVFIKRNKSQIKIENKIQENPKTEEGGVTFLNERIREIIKKYENS